MSHDRKPGRVRVMKAGDEPPQRRRHDHPSVIVDGISIDAPAAGGRRRMMLIVLFLLVAAGAAVVGELYLPQ